MRDKTEQDYRGLPGTKRTFPDFGGCRKHPPYMGGGWKRDLRTKVRVIHIDPWLSTDYGHLSTDFEARGEIPFARIDLYMGGIYHPASPGCRALTAGRPAQRDNVEVDGEASLLERSAQVLRTSALFAGRIDGIESERLTREFGGFAVASSAAVLPQMDSLSRPKA
jgi:hypothetical protein